MNSLEVIALVILILLQGERFISSNNITPFKLPKISLFFSLAIVVYPFFIHCVFLFYRWHYQNTVYPKKIFQITCGTNRRESTWGFSNRVKERGFFINEGLVSDYINLSIIYLCLVAFLFVIIFKRDSLKQFFNKLKNSSYPKKKKATTIEAKIRVLKEMLEAGAITEEEYKDEIKKLKDQFI